MLSIMIAATLVAQETDSQGYTTYVFQLADKMDIEKYQTKYIMCTRWPNWDHRVLNNFEVGYLDCKECRAGIDTYYDGEKFIPYRYNSVQFNKFVNKQSDVKHKFKL